MEYGFLKGSFRGIKVLGIFLCLILASSCTSDKKDNTNDSDVNDVKLEYAELLTFSQGDGYVKVDIKRNKDKAPDISYILVPRDKPVPANIPAGTLIRVPVKSLVMYSSVHASALKELGAVDVVKGVADAGYFKIPEIVNGLKSGAIIDVGSSSSPSLEKIMALKPDGIVISLYEGMNVPDLSSAGIKYIKFADNLETTPLGRAEWLKFIGLLTNKETEADSIFNAVKDRYLHLKNSVSEKTHRPKVMVETMYEGIWYVPGGNSFQANMLTDAGANYPWSDDKSTGSLSLSYEEVLNRCEDADFWIVKVYDKNLTKSSLSELDNRYSHFKSFRNGNIYYSDTSKSQLFEEFPFHPDLLLEDYIKIFHSENNKVDNLRYFNKIGD